ncbi:acyl-CoA thioesterase [Rhizobium leguminosarum]|uniref:acyl-CoA thioesterase n=1 Tax=Rhizobium leguminosarum TaxID=384 RepID=UPI001C954FFB|nr:acyl-CoA thioesterase [Rhizobium leguminosarum]MBY5337885.1 acyl-CoA thioesterase [Rhizobium leguminosarum]MBY5348631.1 acyl-CoA thioesterase [Rhizobium leguminosarum]MBY5612229.1 acyl-CoA thioesterase [Rhizobium leguminosarum]MBY5655693.1 acyl-CoA thioesterase [Rhizobium leguminosarum]MBY5670477.1 acyl-CoA thioesterase [Rhizobium leguminosarum]
MSQSKRPDVAEIRVPFRDVDMTGRMFLASYISYAESVLAGFWSSRPDVDDEPVYSPSKVSCFLHRPLHYDEPATFTATVDKIGVRSIGFLISIETGEERAAEVEIIWQAHAPEDESPAPLPEETRDWLYRFLN